MNRRGDGTILVVVVLAVLIALTMGPTLLMVGLSDKTSATYSARLDYERFLTSVSRQLSEQNLCGLNFAGQNIDTSEGVQSDTFWQSISLRYPDTTGTATINFVPAGAKLGRVQVLSSGLEVKETYPNGVYAELAYTITTPYWKQNKTIKIPMLFALGASATSVRPITTCAAVMGMNADFKFPYYLESRNYTCLNQSNFEGLGAEVMGCIVNCPADSYAVGGAFSWVNSNSYRARESHRSGNGWRCYHRADDCSSGPPCGNCSVACVEIKSDKI